MVRIRKSRHVFYLLVLALVLLSACNNESASKGAEGSEDDKSQIKMMATLHTPEVPEDKILNKLEENTNVELDIQWVPDANYNEKLNTAFATGTLPEAVPVGFQQMNQFKDAIRDDQFWEIGPYLEEFENLSKLKEPILKNTMVDGKIYGIYQGVPLSRQGIIYRKDWADNLGLEAPTTTDEFFEMAKAFTEDDPDGDGKDDTIGLTDRGDLIYGSFKTISSWFGTPNNWGKKDGKLLPEFMFPEYMDTMNFIKDLRDEGYINQDFPVTSKKDQQAMIKNGTAGIYVGSMGDVISLHKDAIELNPDVEYDVHNHVEGPDGEFGVWSVPGYGSQILFPKSSVETEEELKEILGFFDKLMTPENSNLIYWGIEGEHYTVEDGRALPSEDSKKNDREVKPYMSLEVGEPETNGRYESLFTYEPKAKSDKLNKDNEEHLIHDPTVTLESETFIESGERLQQLINDATYNYMLGEIDEKGFNKAIEEWKNQGGSEIIKEYNASYEKVNQD